MNIDLEVIDNVSGKKSTRFLLKDEVAGSTGETITEITIRIKNSGAEIDKAIKALEAHRASVK